MQYLVDSSSIDLCSYDEAQEMRDMLAKKENKASVVALTKLEEHYCMASIVSESLE